MIKQKPANALAPGDNLDGSPIETLSAEETSQDLRVVSRGNVSSMIGLTNILQLGGLAHAHCNYIRFESLDAPSWFPVNEEGRYA